MPTVGPNYFSSGFTNSSYWLSPQNIEGAPDGLIAQNNGVNTPSTAYLFAWDWQGIVPPGFFWDFPNFLIEAYISCFGIHTAIFQTLLIYRSDGLQYGSLSSVISVPLISTMSWKTISNSDWGTPNSKLTTDNPIGFGLSLTNASSIGSISIDSVRMTISYNSNDGFFNPPYGFSKNKRRYKTKRNFQEKIVFEQTKIRMQKKVA